jgi:hypothetical protein
VEDDRLLHLYRRYFSCYQCYDIDMSLLCVQWPYVGGGADVFLSDAVLIVAMHSAIACGSCVLNYQYLTIHWK